MSINKVIIMGNLTRDPQLKDLGTIKVCKMSIATNEKYKRRDGTMTEETCFVEANAWGKTAEFCQQYLHKGKPIFIEGRLKLEQWVNDEGKQNSKHSIYIEKVELLPRNSENKNNNTQRTLESVTPESRTPESRTPKSRTQEEKTLDMRDLPF